MERIKENLRAFFLGCKKPLLNSQRFSRGDPGKRNKSWISKLVKQTPEVTVVVCMCKLSTTASINTIFR